MPIISFMRCQSKKEQRSADYETKSNNELIFPFRKIGKCWTSSKYSSVFSQCSVELKSTSFVSLKTNDV